MKLLRLLRLLLLSFVSGLDVKRAAKKHVSRDDTGRLQSEYPFYHSSEEWRMGMGDSAASDLHNERPGILCLNSLVNWSNKLITASRSWQQRRSGWWRNVRFQPSWRRWRRTAKLQVQLRSLQGINKLGWYLYSFYSSWLIFMNTDRSSFRHFS